MLKQNMFSMIQSFNEDNGFLINRFRFIVVLL